MTEKITAGILAGGRGKRFLPHKGLLSIGGRTIIERQLDTLRSLFCDIVIVTNSFKPYENLNARLISDIILDKGALGAIYSLLKQTTTQHNFIIACDMPYINPSLIKYMLGKINGYDAVVPEFFGRLEPLHSFYSRDCIGAIEVQLEKNNLKIQRFFSLVKTKIIKQEDVEKFDPKGLSFVNINTEEEYGKISSGITD